MARPQRSDRPSASETGGRHPSPAQLYWDVTKGHRLAVGALAMLAVNLLGLVPPILLGRLIDSYTGARVSRAPSTLAAGYVAVFVVQALLRFPLRSGFLGTAVRVEAALRERYAERVLRVSRTSLSSYTPQTS